MRLLLYQLADSGFHTGGLAHSAGLEAALHHGVIASFAALWDFLHDSLEQASVSALRLMRAAHCAPEALPALDDQAEALLSAHVLNRASRTQGRAFLDTASRIFPEALGPMRTSRPPLHPTFPILSEDIAMGHEHEYLHDHGHKHGHPHPDYEDAGHFTKRDVPVRRAFKERAYIIGIGGPVGSGQTALLLALCRALRDRHSLGVVTNDIFTREDAEFLVRHQALAEGRIRAVETGGCPHAAIREDISHNLLALEQLMEAFNAELLFVESGGDNLAAQYSRELTDFTLYVIDVAGGDKVPRKGGPGITQSGLRVINKTDLAELVGADLSVMDRDAEKMRGDGPIVFAQARNNVGIGEICAHILSAWRAATALAG